MLLPPISNGLGVYVHAVCRMSTELASLSNQQNGVLQKRSNENPNPQNTTIVEEFSNDINQQSVRYIELFSLPLYIAIR